MGIDFVARPLFSLLLLVKIPLKGNKMTEEKITKKPGPAKRIFRWVFTAVKWLFVVLLAFLLITCLYFQAPPKVLALIAIILTTLTIIPKRTRKWIENGFG